MNQSNSPENLDVRFYKSDRRPGKAGLAMFGACFWSKKEKQHESGKKKVQETIES